MHELISEASDAPVSADTGSQGSVATPWFKDGMQDEHRDLVRYTRSGWETCIKLSHLPALAGKTPESEDERVARVRQQFAEARASLERWMAKATDALETGRTEQLTGLHPAAPMIGVHLGIPALYQLGDLQTSEVDQLLAMQRTALGISARLRGKLLLSGLMQHGEVSYFDATLAWARASGVNVDDFAEVRACEPQLAEHRSQQRRASQQLTEQARALLPRATE